jgi:hypothetical protein
MTAPTAPPAHPGEIVVVDLDDGIEERRPVADFPESIAFAETDAGLVPVLRIEIFSGRFGRCIRYLDGEGRRLREDMQF